jgi:hypothetical protein
MVGRHHAFHSGMNRLLLAAVCLFLACTPPAPQIESRAAPLPTIQATRATHAQAARCTRSCADGFCWEGCEVRTIPATEPVVDVAVTNEVVAWSDGGGVHVAHRGVPATRLLSTQTARHVATRGGLVVWGAGSRWWIDRGEAEPHGVAVPNCAPGKSDNALVDTDGVRVAVMCVHDLAGPSGMLIRATFDLGLLDATGRLLGTGSFVKDAQTQDYLNVFLVSGDTIVTNDENRIVALDLVKRAPLERVLATVPPPFSPTSGNRGRNGFDIVGEDCDFGCRAPRAPDHALLISTAAIHERIRVPTTASLVKTWGAKRVLRTSPASPPPAVNPPGWELLRETEPGVFVTFAKIDGLLAAAAAPDGTSAVPNGSTLEVRSSVPW